jgi:murein DD-endopeptidase MepM/ murein hydrolase activator NlpD
MHGDDVRAWQRQVNRQLEDWRINYELDVDGDYGDLSRRWSKRVLYGLGMSIRPWHGVTLEARIKARHPESRSPEERATARERRKWLRRLRARYNRVHTPVERIITSSNGYSSFHDGIDLICPPEALIFAVCRAKVIDVRSGGWWGNNPTGNVSLGDGIIQLEALTSIGPLKKGMHIGYGHAEHARVNVGQEVKAGDVLGHAGLANAWHVHFMMNKGDTMRGVGDFDPRACLNLFTSRDSG